MDLKPLTLNDLFDEDGNIFHFCCRSRGDDATPGFHPALKANRVSADERKKILDILNDGRWRIDGEGNFYCPFCVLAMGG